MIEAMYILIIGVIVIGIGYMNIGGLSGKNAKIAMLVGALMVLGGAFYPGYGLWEDMFDVTPTEPTTVISGISFDITPSNGSYTGFSTGLATATVDDDKMGITTQIVVHTSNTFLGNATSVNFSITPTAPLGATADDLVTIYFSIDETQKFDGENIYTESSGTYEAQFAINGYGTIEDYDGSDTMLLTDTIWVEFQCDLDGAGTDSFGEEFDAIGDILTIPIKFWSDGGWTETYTITLICIDAA